MDYEREKDEYKSYKSEDLINVRCRDYYCDKFGIPNKRAFKDYLEHIEADDLKLIALNLDLSQANLKSTVLGDYLLRKFVLSFEDVPIFHIWGEKFNILVHEKELKKTVKILDAKDERYAVYYGVADGFVTHENADKKVSVAVENMYKDREKKRSVNPSLNLLSAKESTPEELMETATKKHRKTMWYSTVRISVKKPVFKEANVTIFVTEFAEPLVSVPIIVVIDELSGIRCEYGRDIHIGIGAVKFSVNCRFNREGNLVTSVYEDDSDKETDVTIGKPEIHEGVCVPANFGKRIKGRKEIYPVKANLQGYFSYVVLDLEKKKIKYINDGMIEMDGKKYGVYQDSQYIDLVEQ